MSELTVSVEEIAADFAHRLLAVVRRTSLAELAALPAADSRRAPRRASRVRTVRSTARRWAQQYELSATELEILLAAAEGSSRDDVARTRGVSVNTVKRQIFTLLGKTGDASLLHAVTRLLREVIGPERGARQPNHQTARRGRRR